MSVAKRVSEEMEVSPVLSQYAASFNGSEVQIRLDSWVRHPVRRLHVS